MTDTRAAAARDALELVSLVAGLAITVYVVWMFLPVGFRDRLRVETVGSVEHVMAGRRAAAERRTAELTMEFEVFAASAALSAYDKHRDAERLARDLESHAVDR